MGVSLVDLHVQGCMVFRLGQPKGSRTTHFALAKVVNDWSDYFLIDQAVFEAVDSQVFLPSASVRSLFAFQLLPTLTETSLINLALASELLPKALGIAPSKEQIIPATGQCPCEIGCHDRVAGGVSTRHNSSRPTNCAP